MAVTRQVTKSVIVINIRLRYCASRFRLRSAAPPLAGHEQMWRTIDVAGAVAEESFAG